MKKVKFCHFVFLLLASCSRNKTACPSSEVAVPSEWHCLSPCQRQDQNLSLDSPDTFFWWHSFCDPLLSSLIQRASEENLQLSIAAERIAKAREEYRASEGSLYPHVDASLAAGGVYYSKKGVLGRLVSSNLHEEEKNRKKRSVDFFEGGFDATWEIDFFGMHSHQRRALKAKVESAEEELCAAWLSLSAEVAKNYIELRLAQQQLIFNQKNGELQGELLSLEQELLAVGMSDFFKVEQAQQELNQLLAERTLLKLSCDKAIHRLSLLLALPPGCLYEELAPFAPLPLLPSQQPIGIPSELLNRRPDIRKSQRDLAVASALVDSAIAQFFPRLLLRGFIGEIAAFFSSCSPFAATAFIEPQLLLPLFNSKLIQEDVIANKIEVRQACYRYQEVVLNALEETENGIASFQQELERHQQLLQIEKERETSLDLLFLLCQRGLKDRRQCLASHRSLLAAQQATLQSKATLLLNSVALYKAVAGGWRNE